MEYRTTVVTVPAKIHLTTSTVPVESSKMKIKNEFLYVSPLEPYGTVLLTEKCMQVFEYCILNKYNQHTNCIYSIMLIIVYSLLCTLGSDCS